jgi:hypothetical protein
VTNQLVAENAAPKNHSGLLKGYVAMVEKMIDMGRQK